MLIIKHTYAIIISFYRRPDNFMRDSLNIVGYSRDKNSVRGKPRIKGGSKL